MTRVYHIGPIVLIAILALNAPAVGKTELVKVKAMVSSMTPGERQSPELIQKSRASRIAAGSGRKPKEVTDLIKRFDQMKGMMAMLGQQSGLMGKVPGMGKFAGGMPGMGDMAGAGGMPGFDPMAMLGGAGGGGSGGQTKRRTSSADRKKKQKQAKKSRRKGRKK